MNRVQFFDVVRKRFGSLKQEQVDALDFLLDKLESDSPDRLEHAAYMLATIKHETADTYLPVKEAYWVKNAEEWRRRNLRYYPWYGRGYVQLTWEENYRRAGQKLDLDFITDPDAVMEPEASYLICLEGMREGWFTGKKLSNYIKGSRVDYWNARRIINGTDKAGLVQGYANSFAKALLKSEYSV